MYDRPQPADSGLALWLAIRSWDSDSRYGVMDLGVEVGTILLLVARSPCPHYGCCYGACGTQLCFPWLPNLMVDVQLVVFPSLQGLVQV